MSTHTYLLEQGIWGAEGDYWDGDGHHYPVTGGSRVIHEPDRWRVVGQMTVSSDPAVSFSNRYDLRPITPGCDTAEWTSDNPALGRLVGQFTLIAEAILSVYRSEEGEYQGAEVLRQLAADRYAGWGALFQQGRKLSSWSVRLIRST